MLAARRTGLSGEYDEYRAAAARGGLDPDEAETVVAVLVDLGLAPVKQEAFVLVPTTQGFPVKLAVPEFISRPCGHGLVAVSVDGDEAETAEPVANVDALARHSLEQKRGRVLTKAVARAVSKQLLARQAET